MAVVYAVKNGSWSDTSTWNTGQLPQPGDTVCANGYTVTIDQDVDLWVNGQPAGIITTRAYDPAVAGGSLTCSRANTTIRCQRIEAYTTALSISASGCAVYSDVYGSNHPSTTSLYGINYSGTGTLEIYGSVYGGSGAYHHYGVNNASTGTVQIIGNVTGGSSPHCYGVNNASTGTVQITGNATGGNGGGSFGVNNGSTGTVNIIGTAHYGKAAPAIFSIADGTLRVVGDLYADPSPAVCWTGSGAYCAIDGNEYGGVGGVAQGTVAACVWKRAQPQTKNRFIRVAEANEDLSGYSGNPGYFYGALYPTFNHPSESDVRYGVSYGPNNELTGTCHVPPPESVLYGVPVDDTVGTAAVTPEAIAAAVWNAQRNNHSESGTFGAVGEWAGGGGGGSDWTEAERAQIRHRLGIDGDSAQPQSASPSLAPATAQAVWSHTPRTLTAATTDWTDAERQQIRHRLGIDGQAAQPQSATPSLMAAGGYTTERAQRLDNVDVPVSSRSTLTAAQAAQAVWNHDSRTLTGTVVVGAYVGGQSPGEHMAALGYTSARAGNLDNLDARVSSRSTLTAADVWNHSQRSLTVAITDWSDDERRQIRYRLGISGDRQQPTGVDPDLAVPGDAMTLTQETIEAIAQAVTLGTVQVVVQPLQVHVQRTYTATDTIELWRDARGLISIWLPGVDLSEHELAIQVYERSGQTIPTATWRDEITVSVQDQGTLVQADVPRERMLAAGSYQYVLRDITSQVVLAHGRLVVHWAPDATA